MSDPHAEIKNIREAFDLATRNYQAGNFPEAQTLCRRILSVHPNHAEALHLLGIIAGRTGQNQDAEKLFLGAISINPTAAVYHNNLGKVLMALGKMDEATRAYRRAIELKPDYPEACSNLGACLRVQGQFDAAVKAYQRALQLKPDRTETHNNLGNLLKDMDRLEESIASFQKALKIKPDYADAYSNLSAVLAAQGKLDAAVEACQTAIRLNPNLTYAYVNLGHALKAQSKLDEAVAAYRTALNLTPRSPEIHNALGAAFLVQQRYEQAFGALQTAIQIKPDYADAHSNMGYLLKEQRQIDAAVVAYRRALQLKPDMACALNNLGNLLKDQGRLDEAIVEYRKAMELEPDDSRVYSNLLYNLNFHPGFDAGKIQNELSCWNRRFAEPLKEFIKPHENDHDPERRLKIGYVSPDFFSHAESYFVMPLLEAHDHQKFEIHGYASVERPDETTERFKSCCNVWHDVLGKTDQELADQIRRDQIDILIDLTMHMGDNRILVFARKPAPVQVTWLAYPGTTGLDAIDYRISDAFMDPPDVPTPYYPEETIRLPDFWCCYDPLSKADTAPRAPREDGPICFGSLNNPCKLNEPILRLWGQVLQSTPGSQIMILSPSMDQRNRISLLYEQMNIDATRLIFVGRTARAGYLQYYDRIDIGLDPLPYNGITTTLDALWMGVPVISLAGSTAAGRAGLGILSTLGMPELAAHSPEQLVQIASALAGDLPRLAELSKNLRQRMQTSPLMDTKRFARNIEAAYREMWRRWCKNQEE
jgi:protein O-GlcNAc transferase